MLSLPNEHLVVGFIYPIIKILDMKRNFMVIQQLIGHTGQVWALVQVKNEILASGSSDESIKVWNSGQLVKNLTGHLETV